MNLITPGHELRSILLLLYSLLALSTVVSWGLSLRASSEEKRKTMSNVTARIWAWWLMLFFLSLALVLGPVATTLLFTIVSFCALREFITLTPTAPGDHRTLFWVFFFFLPVQYLFVGSNWYGMFAIFVPVYAFLFLPLRSVLAGDCERFLERAAKIQWGLMICVYCVSHAPALLMLSIPGYEGRNAELLLFLVIVVELSDILQFVWGKTYGQRPIAPAVSPNKTIEGFVGGILSATVVGALLSTITPFTISQAFLVSLLICLVGFSGGLVMSAIKRDRGVKDYGTMLSGHGGMMDRIDSLCFSAPIFFHVVRYFFTV